jgi:hypothetical protein
MEKIIILKGKSRHGKNRVNQFGREWVLKKTTSWGTMVLSPKDNVDLDTRQVKIFGDKNFSWEQEKGITNV